MNIDKIRYNGVDYDINKDNYSTDEQRIGTWIDGKPLYRKVIVFQSPTLNARVDHGVPNIDKLVNLGGNVSIGTDEMKPLSTVHMEDGSVNDRFTFSVYRFNRTATRFAAGGYYQDNISNLTVTLIVEYTKTTDTVEN